MEGKREDNKGGRENRGVGGVTEHGEDTGNAKQNQ